MELNNNTEVYIDLDKPRQLRMTNSVLKKFSSIAKIKISDLDQALERFDLCNLMVSLMLQQEDHTLD